MTQSVLFINPPIVASGGLFNTPALVNLGMLYTAALCRRHYNVKILDAFCFPDSLMVQADGVMYGTSLEKLFRQAAGYLQQDSVWIIINFSSFLKSGLSGQAAEWNHFFTALKNCPGTRGILLADCLTGSAYYRKYDPTPLMEQFPPVTAVLQGIAAENLLDFLAADQADWPQIPGLVYRQGNSLLCNKADYAYSGFPLDNLAFPAYDLLDLPGYFHFLKEATAHNLIQENNWGEPFLAVMASRGCDHSCHFCGLHELPHRWQGHSPEYLERMLVYLQMTTGVTRFVLLDPCANNNPHWFKQVLKIFCRHEFACSIPNGLRADNLDEETLALLKSTINVLLSSAESANLSLVPGKFKPGFTIRELENLAARCYALDLPLKLHFMIGFPGETPASIFKTLAFAIELYDSYNCIPLLQIVTPLPGTGLYTSCKGKQYFVHPEAAMQKLLDQAKENRALLETPWLGAGQLQLIFENFQQHIFNGRQRELVLAPSFACNNRCIHCFVAEKKARQRSLEEYFLLMQQARAEHRDVICLEGGEPTLLPHLDKILARAKRLGFRNIMLESNGRRFAYRQYARKIVESGANVIYIGLHSWLEEEHDAVTCVPGSYRQTRQGLSNLLAEKIETLYVNIALTKINYRSLVRTAGLCADLGVHGIFIQYLTHNSRLRHQASLPAYSAVTGYICEAIEACRDRMQILVQNIPYCCLPGYQAFIHPDMNHIGELEEADGSRFNLVQALASGRIKDSTCSQCSYSFLCSGRLVFTEAG